MNPFKLIEQYFWVFFLLSGVFALTLSEYGAFLGDYLIPILMFVLFLIFLKIDVVEVLDLIKKPKLLIYIVLMNLVVIPVVIYLFSLPLEKEVVIGIFLLATLPSGVSSAALTDIIKGKTSLALVITVLSTFIAPFTMTGLFYLLLKTSIQLDYLGMFFTLLKLIFIPAVAAEIIKPLFRKKIEAVKHNFDGVIVICAGLLIVGIIGKEADFLLSNISELVVVLVILYAVFFIFQLGGYFMVYWLDKPEKIAVSNSKTFMNSALGIVIAYTFFSPKVAIILILSEIPWSTMLIVFKIYKKYLP